MKKQLFLHLLICSTVFFILNPVKATTQAEVGDVNSFCAYGYEDYTNTQGPPPPDLRILYSYPGTPSTNIAHFCRASEFNTLGRYDGNLTVSPIHVSNIVGDSGKLTFILGRGGNSGFYMGYKFLPQDNFTYIDLNGTDSHYIIDGDYEIITTDVDIKNGDNIYLSYEDQAPGHQCSSCVPSGSNFYPGYGPGWKFINPNNTATWMAASGTDTYNDRIQALINFYTPYKVSNRIQDLFIMSWADTDSNGWPNVYYDFEDAFIAFAITQVEPPVPACAPATDISMTATPNPLTLPGTVSFSAYKASYPNNLTVDSLNIDQTGLTGCAIGTNTANCTGNIEGAYNWIANYTIYNSTGHLSRTCSKTSSFTLVEPAVPECNYGTPYPVPNPPLQDNSGDILMSASPFLQTRLKNIQFSVSIANYTYPLTFLSLNIDPAGASNCISLTPARSLNCLASGLPNTYLWSSTYRIFNQTGHRSKDCTKTSIFQIQDPPGYMLTSGGDVYIQSGFSMPSYEDYSRSQCSTVKTRCFSEYLYAYNQYSIHTNTTPECSNCSKSNFTKTGYADQNANALNYDVLKANVIARVNLLGTGRVQLIQNVDTVDFTTASNNQRVVIFNGNLTIGTGTDKPDCRIPSIFFIPGDLTINPDFTINNYTNASGKNMACMFIIKGSLIINGGINKPNDNYDLIHGFFILTSDSQDSLVIPVDNYNLIRIIGGIVQKNVSISTVSRKAFGSVVLPIPAPPATPIVNMPPAEEIIYEGGRYISIFNDIFIDPSTFYNITELPYINTLQ